MNIDYAEIFKIYYLVLNSLCRIPNQFLTNKKENHKLPLSTTFIALITFSVFYRVFAKLFTSIKLFSSIYLLKHRLYWSGSCRWWILLVSVQATFRCCQLSPVTVISIDYTFTCENYHHASAAACLASVIRAWRKHGSLGRPFWTLFSLYRDFNNSDASLICESECWTCSLPTSTTVALAIVGGSCVSISIKAHILKGNAFVFLYANLVPSQEKVVTNLFLLLRPHSICFLSDKIPPNF